MTYRVKLTLSDFFNNLSVSLISFLVGFYFIFTNSVDNVKMKNVERYE